MTHIRGQARNHCMDGHINPRLQSVPDLSRRKKAGGPFCEAIRLRQICNRIILSRMTLVVAFQMTSGCVRRMGPRCSAQRMRCQCYG